MGSEAIEGYALEFENIELSVLQSGKEKDILNGVNGRFRPGRLSAIMGPSGAGKTKLLNILSGVKSFGFKGSIKINGVQRNLQTFRQLSCYIAQEFSMFTVLTVRETLDIAAHIKVGNKIKKSERNHLILKIAKILGLTEALDTRVNKLSGGEMKRLSIGVELTTNPPIMFFDEPTSGLDSVSSLQIVTHLKSLAQEGRTIIMVVHQPSSKIVNIIDDIFILADGKCLYNGPMDDLLPTLSSLGIDCPPYYNRADLALEVACKEHGDCIEQLARLASSKHYDRLGSFYEDHKIIFKSQMDQNEEDTVTEQNVMLKKENEFVSVKLNIDGNETIKKKFDKNKSSRYSVSNFTQFQILLKRSAICILRDVKLATLKLITHILTGIALGIVYYNFGGDGSKVVSTLSCLFFMIIFVFYGTTLHTVMIFPMESAAVIREHSNNWYSLGMYQLAKTVADVPLHIVCPTLFLSIAWYLTDLPHEWDRFLKIWLISVLLSVFAQTFGCIMGVIFEPQVGLFLAATLTMPTFLISGFFIHLNDLPPYIWWLSYISIFRYSLEASVIAVYGVGRGVLKCNVPYCHFKHPRKILEEMGMENGDYWFNADVLIMLAVVSQIVLYCTLRLKVQSISRKT